MPVVDYEGAWFSLKAHLAECSRNNKRSHGYAELTEKLAELEVHHRIPEGQEGYDDRPPRSHGSDRQPAHDEPVAAASGAS